MSGLDHVNDETIALLALGEAVGGSDADHLHACAACQSKVDQLRAIVDTARTITDDDRPITPPDDLWKAITDEIESDGGVFAKRPPARGARMGWFALAAAVGVLIGSLGTIVALDQQRVARRRQAPAGAAPGRRGAGIHAGAELLLRLRP